MVTTVCYPPYQFTVETAFDHTISYPGQDAAAYVFQQLFVNNWEINDVYFDNHYTYPAGPDERCVNVDICYHSMVSFAPFAAEDDFPRIDYWPASNNDWGRSKIAMRSPVAVVENNRYNTAPIEARPRWSSVCSLWWYPSYQYSARLGSIKAWKEVKNNQAEVWEKHLEDREAMESFWEAHQMEINRAQTEPVMFYARLRHRQHAGANALETSADEEEFIAVEQARLSRRTTALRAMEDEYGPSDGDDRRFVRERQGDKEIYMY